MTSLEAIELVDRIWARDPTIWTGSDEGHWLGWLDEPARMLERLEELEGLESDFEDVVLLGMGGSSLAPEVIRRTFAADKLHVLDTTHPSAIRRLEGQVDLGRTLFIAASKSGTTLETRSQLDYFLERGGGASFAAITDPGTELEQFARDHDFAWVVHGEPTIGGRYSALSPFGMVPAALLDLDVQAILERADAMAGWCRLGEEETRASSSGWSSPRAGTKTATRSASTRLRAGSGCGRSSCSRSRPGSGARGSCRLPARIRRLGPTASRGRVRLDDPYDLGAEFFRWEFATAVAGSILGINPFDQPDVQAAKDKTSELLSQGTVPQPGPEGSLDDLLAQAEPPQYIAIQAFIDPEREGELDPLVVRARETGCVVTKGLGPRYLHSTGQLHKGGPNTVLAIQVVDDLGEELAIPGKEFGFKQLISAQATGDLESLKERGRTVCRVRLEDV